MTALLFGLHGCALPDSGADCDKSDPCAAPDDTGGDTADDTADDTGSVPDPFETCANGVDDDGDGRVDEPGCAIAWRVGDESLYAIGGELAVANGENSVWACTARKGSAGPQTVGGLYMDEGSNHLDVLWTIPDDKWYYAPFMMGTADGALFASATYGKDSGFSVDVFDVPRVGDPTPETSLLATLEAPGALGDVDMLEGVSDPRLLVGTLYSGVFLLDQFDFASTPIEDNADAVIDDAERNTGLGYAVLLLPDPSGDGIADTVLGLAGGSPYYNASGVYFFDGTLRGALSPDDADAAIVDSDTDGFGTALDRVGDLDGDGVEDLAVRYSNVRTYLWFGPFLDWTTPEDAPSIDTSALAAGLAPDGDDVPDLAVEFPMESGVGVFRGPIPRGALDWEGADFSFEPDGMDPYLDVVLSLVDVDANGSSELVIGDQGFRGADDDPAQDAPGAIVVFGLLGP